MSLQKTFTVGNIGIVFRTLYKYAYCLNSAPASGAILQKQSILNLLKHRYICT